MPRKAAKRKSAPPAPIDYRVPAEVRAIVQGKVMDLRGISLFCRRQAECAALFGKIVETRPGMFALKSPFRENFIGSLHVYQWPNARFSSQETIASALVRHAKWYLSVRDIDALREKVGSESISPRLLRGSMEWAAGIIRPTGEFTTDPEAGGTAAILAWQDDSGDPPAIAIEISGQGVSIKDPAFHRRLLESMIDWLSIELKLKHSSAGRPHLAAIAESAAYHRDHLKVGRKQIAKILCSCGSTRHTQKCFDRLNKLADSFYRNQRTEFAKLVREQTRKYPEINS
jgi:hypothetical protein